jgi:acyl dehydratase
MPRNSIEKIQSMVGDTRVTVENLRVEAGKVEEFARSLKDDNPAFRSAELAREQGYECVPAPLSFTRTAYFPRYQTDQEEWDLGFRQEYVVHGEQEYEFERPLYVGDVLTGKALLEDVYQRDGSRGGTMTFAVIVTEFRDQDGELVLTERKTRIETEGAIEDGDEE